MLSDLGSQQSESSLFFNVMYMLNCLYVIFVLLFYCDIWPLLCCYIHVPESAILVLLLFFHLQLVKMRHQ